MNLVKTFQKSGMKHRLAKVKQMASELKEELMLKKIGIISLSFLLCACSLGVQLKKSMFTIELGKDIYANPTLYLKNATFSSRLKVVSKSVGVDKKNNRFMTSGMDYLVVGEYDFAIVDGSKEYPL